VRGLRLSPSRYALLCRIALVGLVAIVVTGGAVRLTGSGLGCSDWPTCEHDRLVAPLQFHPMVEFVNRVVTLLVSLVVIAAVLGALARRPRRRDLVWLACGLVAGVVAQILLGAALVVAHLDPRFTIGHFLLSALLVGDSVVLAHRAGRPDLDPGVARPPRRIRRLTGLLVALGGAVLVSGTIVTGTGPHGGDERADRLGFDITDVTRAHSLLVWAFLALLGTVALLLARSEGPGPRLVAVRRLLALAVLQGGLGYAQYFAGVPPLLVGFHLLGATLVWAATVEVGLLVLGRPGDAVGPGRNGERYERAPPGGAGEPWPPARPEPVTGGPRHPGTLAGGSGTAVPVVPARGGLAAPDGG
jgi:heme a synthase